MELQRRNIIQAEERNAIGFFISLLLCLSFNGSKKGMIANMLGGFITILIGVSLMGPIAQELNNALDCNSTLNDSLLMAGIPEGSTDSFGGAGSTHFGGYTGEVEHKTFTETIASTSMYKTNKSVLNPECINLDGTWGGTIIKIVPGFFALALLVIGIAVAFSSLRRIDLI